MTMRLISFKIPAVLLEGIDQLVRHGLYPSRSEAIRVAIRDFLKRELPATVWANVTNVSMLPDEETLEIKLTDNDTLKKAEIK